jgi:putative hydrolase of the HAD superfamily
MEIKTIIFDLGGVVLDIDPQLSINEFKKLGLKDESLFKDPDFVKNVIRKFEKGILTPEVFRNKIREYTGLDLTDHQIDDAWNALLYDIPAERIRVLEEVKKNYKILLFSNSNEIHYDLYVRDLQLRFGYMEFDKLFDKAYFSFDLHLSKPDVEGFEYIMYQNKLVPEETLFIDDLEANINAAKSLGWKTYRMVPPERVRDIFTDGKLNPGLNIE